MSLRMLKLLSILAPVLIIGGFEYIRHEFLLNYLTMEAGNFTITVITFLLSYLFASWMFHNINRNNEKLAAGEARRAVYEERERLARELHDDLAQTLFFLNVKLKQGHVEEAKAAVAEIDNSLRQAIYNLRTPPVEGHGFALRLHKWLRDWQLVTEIELETKIQIAEDSFGQADEVLLFGIIQEGFTNIRKHSGATRASIILEANPASWQLQMKDNGCGLQENDISGKRYGIELMRKRAAELSAELTLASIREGGRVAGTEIRLSAHHYQ
ncbi:sensor histidine kinase [Paenibacillus aestuarii]|uniref:histidine kinase n=1 Tax=Paenibacillus aestuarii TaxID=516965 RepID=A0ABW0KAP2_9BACL|nr:histidine kinase [Paenibacillus aestuarii]